MLSVRVAKDARSCLLSVNHSFDTVPGAAPRQQLCQAQSPQKCQKSQPAEPTVAMAHEGEIGGGEYKNGVVLSCNNKSRRFFYQRARYVDRQ